MDELMDFEARRFATWSRTARLGASAIRQSVTASIRKFPMHIGLIAGNGRFPFLVLDAARAQGHDVTVIALKEEAFAELDAAAASRQAAIHWISIGQVGKCIDLLKAAGATT